MYLIADLWNFLVYVLLPYITIAVFVGGLIYRVRGWIRLPRAKAVIYPAASSSLDTVSRVAGDILLFRKTFNGSKGLWGMAFSFHVGLGLVIVGHFRTVTEVSWLWNLFDIGEAGIEDISFVLGAIAGFAMFIAALLLLARRLAPKWRVLSLFEDYFALALLLAIIIIGNYMRLFSPVNLEEIRQYATGVLTFHPALTVSNPLFLWHFFLAQILIMYLPFSKLIHVISKPITDSWTVR
jgi:nitrate reductase gamma subunit